MKWSVVGLLALGVIAAISAAVLVAALQSGRAKDEPSAALPPGPPEVGVLVAASDLEPMTVIESPAVERRSLPQDLVPPGAFAAADQVIGRVLVAPVRAGAPFTRAHFASEGSALHLASALSRGMRAVSLTLSDSMEIESLLYPGCAVDVLFSTRIPRGESEGEQPLALTLLENVFVLAVGDRTVVARGTPSDEGPVLQRSRRPSVTLLVSPREAEILKLAMQEGSLSLALRNPQDESAIEREPADLAVLSPVLAALEERYRARERALSERRGDEAELARLQLEEKKLMAQRRLDLARGIDPDSARWDTIVLRGGEVEVLSFQLEEAPPR